ncbi:MAG: DUF1801 domain-containing protein [Bacteroidia bacterium]
MQSKAVTVKDYLESLPEDRKKAITQLRKEILKNIPKGFKEEMNYGMIGYVIPHKLYPHGYHCDPTKPLPYMNIASQKNFIAVYHMGVYGDKKLLDWFTKEFKKASDKKLDMGKACIRFKKPEDIPYKLIGELAGKISAEQWMAVMDKYRKK